jgi:uncharacterized protein YjgD (DUF1641 family)
VKIRDPTIICKMVLKVENVDLGELPAETYDTLDAMIMSLLKIASSMDVEKLEKIFDLLERLLPIIGDVADKLDEKTIESLTRLVDLLPKLSPLIEELGKIAPCIKQGLEKSEKAEPVSGLRGLFGMLRDPEVQKALGKIKVILKEIGKC